MCLSKRHVKKVFAKENMKITKKWKFICKLQRNYIKIKIVNSNKRMSKGYIHQY